LQSLGLLSIPFGAIRSHRNVVWRTNSSETPYCFAIDVISEIAPVGSSSISKYVTTPVKFANSSTYLRMMVAANIPAEANVSVYYKTCTGDSSKLSNAKYTLAIPDGSVIKVDNGDPTFSDITYTLTGITSFDTVMVKIVLNSTNSAAVPIVKDFRLIACP
jgi:hypothetical protein